MKTVKRSRKQLNDLANYIFLDKLLSFDLQAL